MSVLLSSLSSLLSKTPNPPHTSSSLPNTHSLSFSLLTTRPTFSSLRFHSTFSKPLSSAADGDNVAGDFPAETTDEWGEKSRPEIETPTKLPDVDPPKDEDEWGGEVAVGAGGVVDEWGERGETEIEPPSSKFPDVDKPKDEDEWGERGEEEIEMPSSNSADTDPPKDEDGWVGVGVNGGAADEEEGLKRRLVDLVYGTDFGFRASTETRAEVLELVSQLEALNPTPAPTEAAEILDGNWVLV